MFDYTLAVLTHGDMGTLDQSLNSFFDKVKPAPARVIIHADGTASTLQKEWTLTHAEGWQMRMGPEQRGFCRATEALWRWASDPAEDPPPYTFWLEHDFVFLRPVHLHDLAVVLSDDERLCQMQLMRTPVSHEEIAAGGLYESRPDTYMREAASLGDSWLSHRAYFSTNPSLMRTAFMAANPWPDDDEPFCEGRFGIDLVRRGFHFGVWGAGEPWVEHVGVRSGFGY